MVYEAEERIRDPVHGCAGVIKDLQRKVAELQLQLEATQLELANVSVEHGNLLTVLTGYEPHGSYANFYTAPLQEVEDTIINPNVSGNKDPLLLCFNIWITEWCFLQVGADLKLYLWSGK